MDACRLFIYWSLLLFFCSISQSSDAVFASAKALGMAATGIAYPQDSFAPAYNPAGLTHVPDRFDSGVNYYWGKGRGEIKKNLNPLFNGDFNGMRTNYVWDLELAAKKDLPCHLSAGLALYNRDYIKTTYKPALAIFGRGKTGLEYIHETIAATGAARVHPCHSVGISFNYMIQRFKLNGLQNSDVSLIPGLMPTVFPGHVTNRDYNYSSSLGVSFGWLGRFTRHLTIGLVYQPKTHMSRLHKYKGFIADKGRFDIPRQAGIGITFLPCPGLNVTVDVERIWWQDTPALKNPLLPNVLISQGGKKDGPGFGWRNQTIYRIGADYKCSETWTVRAGYRHGQTPIKSDNCFPNLLTLYTVQDVASLGATWTWNCFNEISFFYLTGFPHAIHKERAIPLLFGGGSVTLKESVNLVGLFYGHLY